MHAFPAMLKNFSHLSHVSKHIKNISPLINEYERCFVLNDVSKILIDNQHVAPHQKISIILPVYTPFGPKIPKLEIVEPLSNKFPLNRLILDVPLGNISPIMDKYPLWPTKISFPTLPHQAPEMQAGGGWTMIRRRKSMKKHWRRKHFKRDIVIYKKRERKRKLAAEKVFRENLSLMMREAEDFDAKKYVEEFLGKVPWDKEQESAPMSILVNESTEKSGDTSAIEDNSDRKRLKHWKDVISIEQLFGLPPSTRIDKDAGKADEDEWNEIKKARKRYDETFRRRNDGEN